MADNDSEKRFHVFYFAALAFARGSFGVGPYYTYLIGKLFVGYIRKDCENVTSKMLYIIKELCNVVKTYRLFPVLPRQPSSQSPKLSAQLGENG